ncbi:MAG: YgaP-like transmembrane domain [Acidobacteriaceae bacterium]
MSSKEESIRYAIGSAAAATAIFAPLSYPWKAILAAVAAETILTGIYGVSPIRKLSQT